MSKRLWQMAGFVSVSLAVAGGMLWGSDERVTALAQTGGNNPGNTGDDRFHPNSTKTIVDGRPGGVDSPRLGTIRGRRDFSNIALSQFNSDWFRFATTRTTGPRGFVRLEVTPWNRRIQLILRDRFGTQLRTSQGTAIGVAPFPSRPRLVRVPFANRPGGTYYVQVTDEGLGNTQSLRETSRYNLVIDPQYP